MKEYVLVENERKDVLIGKLTANLPVLRTMLHLSQSDFAKLLGMSRQQIVAIENKKRKMTWSTFLAAVLIFKSNEETNQLLPVFGIYTEDLEEFIKKKDDRSTDI